MPKKKTPPPDWFPALSDTAPYTTVSLSEEETEEWLDELARAFQTPVAVAEIERHFQELYAFQTKHIKSLSSVDWGRYDGHQLIWWGIADLTLHHAIEVFLPAGYRASPEPVRTWLYLLILILMGVAEAAKPHTQYPDPLALARRAIHVRLAGPYAAKEISRRMVQHVGSPVGSLLFLKELYQFDAATPLLSSADIDLLISPIMDKLRKSIRRQTADRVYHVIQDKTLISTALKVHLSSEIYETIVTRWGGLEGLDALARSLDGKFNITPIAVADRIMKPDRLAELFPFLEERGILRLPEDGVIEVERKVETDQKDDERSYKSDRLTVSITEKDDSYPTTRAQQAEEVLEKFFRRYPKHRDGIDLWLSEEPLENLATTRGVTIQTIINRKNRAYEALRQFAKEPPREIN